MRDLRPLLAPTSIAIVGASSRPNTVASRPLTNLQQIGYDGDIYLVNPNRTKIGAIRCYPNLDELPKVPEVVLLVVSSKHVMPMLENCSKLGVKADTTLFPSRATTAGSCRGFLRFFGEAATVSDRQDLRGVGASRRPRRLVRLVE